MSRYDPAPEAGTIECVWCGEKTCLERKSHDSVTKYVCISCDRTFWT